MLGLYCGGGEIGERLVLVGAFFLGAGYVVSLRDDSFGWLSSFPLLGGHYSAHVESYTCALIKTCAHYGFDYYL